MAIDWSTVTSRMDVLNKRNRAQQAEDARLAAIRARPAWELMRLREQIWLDPEEEPELTYPAGTIALRINQNAHLKAISWPSETIGMFQLEVGMVFFAVKPRQFDYRTGLLMPDDMLEHAYDAENAMPRKCLQCGAEAHNRGLFSCDEPVFFCDAHYKPKSPMLLPGDGYSESTRADRV